jgi:hypothetical protein
MRTGDRGRKIQNAKTCEALCQISLIVCRYRHWSKTPSGPHPLSSRGVTLNCAARRGKPLPDGGRSFGGACPAGHFNPEEKLESFLHQFTPERGNEGAF